MAFGLKKIFPIDTKPGTAVGISLPFNGNTGFNSTYTTAAAIKANLLNYFLTNQGDRYSNPTFGGNLRQFIFEQISGGTFDYVIEDIQSKIATYFPSVKVHDVSIDKSVADADTNIITVSITYSVINTGINDNLQIAFT